MKKRKLRGLLCGFVMGTVIFATGISACAIDFTVKIGDTSAPDYDPISKRVIKNGGELYENKAYYTITSLSPSAGILVGFNSYNLNNNNIHTKDTTYLGSLKLSGNAVYNQMAPAGVYYYMSSEASSRTTVTGRYTP